MRGDIAMFLGLVTVIGGAVIAAVVLLVGGNGGNNPCDNPQPPRGESDISESGFQTEDAGLTTVIDAASAGDLEAAEEAFFGDVQDFTYDVGQPLREANEDLAKELCEAVNSMEEELTVNQRADRVATHAIRIRDLLRDAAEALGLARPGE